MNYDENVFKEKANIKARRIWLVFALYSQPTMAPMPQTACIRFLITLFL